MRLVVVRSGCASRLPVAADPSFFAWLLLGMQAGKGALEGLNVAMLLKLFLLPVAPGEQGGWLL